MFDLIIDVDVVSYSEAVFNADMASTLKYKLRECFETYPRSMLSARFFFLKVKEMFDSFMRVSAKLQSVAAASKTTLMSARGCGGEKTIPQD